MISRSSAVGLVLLVGTASILAVPAADSGTAELVAEARPGNGSPTTPLVFTRRWEPNEHAYSYLVPREWQSDGGMFNVSPLQRNGPANSIMPKNDLTVRSDAIGTVYFRWLPAWYYADFAKSRTASMTASFFPVGSEYQGMEVRLLPTWQQFLETLFRSLHPRAESVKIIESHALPKLADLLRQRDRQVDSSLRAIGLPGLEHQAGGMVVEYTEGGTRYCEGLITALIDNRGSALSWNNEYTHAMRAPADQAEDFRPVFNILRQSVQLDPQWLNRVLQASSDRVRIARATQEHIERIGREIAENRARTQAEIRYESYLFLTGQDDYVNPYTGKVEVDSNEYPHRWTTHSGDLIYSKDREFDPNRIRELNHVEWKATPVRERSE